MYRQAIEFLYDWKQRKTRKPLILRGARQVGKTYLIEQFAGEFEIFIKINFEKDVKFRSLFATNDVKSILENIGLAYGKKIVPQKSLLFLDEIQAFPEAITTLRYFYETIPELYVIAAGSLLDHVLNEMDYSMPVGRVEFMYMYPLSFKEFLLANDEKMIVEYLSRYNLGKEISIVIHEKLLKLLRTYFFIGGMPEAVKVYKETSDLLEVERVHESILTSLEIDFSKYGKKINYDHLRMVLQYVPRGLGKKVKYVNVDSSVKSGYLKQAFRKLEMSRVIHPVVATSTANVPLKLYARSNVFKPLFFDIGLATHQLKIRLMDFENLMLVNEGDLAEQFIGQQLLTRDPFFIDRGLFYWIREKRDANAEIDYLIEVENNVIPVEVKAGKTGTLKSLHVFMSEKQKEFAIRFNSDLPGLSDVKTTVKMGNAIKQIEYKLMSLPLYMVNFIDQIRMLDN